MSDNDTTQTAIPALDPVQVTLDLPGRLFRDYSRLAELGLYLSTEEALRQAVLTSWRFDRGVFHSVRLDLGDDDEDADKAAQELTPSAEA